MAQNQILYEGRIINNNGQCKVSKSKQGNVIVDLLIAEQFQERNDRTSAKFKDPTKAADAYVDTTTAWHRVRIMGAAAEAIARDDRYNHGAILDISAGYVEDANEWVDKGGVTRVSRSETVFLDNKENRYWADIKKTKSGMELTPRDENRRPLWDGRTELPALGGAGSGLPPAPEYADNEGF